MVSENVTVATPQEEDYLKLLSIAKETFSAERYEKIEKLFEHFKPRMLVAPASSYVHFHNSFEGGYVDHILHVIQAAYKVSEAYSAIGGNVDYTESEMVFSAMFHDLGKLGDLHRPYYVPQTSEWHVKNMGQNYKVNKDTSFMSITDRALYLLQQFDIKTTEKEWVAIKCSDGLFDEANRNYFINFQHQHINTNLHIVIHTADYLSSRSESEAVRDTTSSEVVKND